MSTTTNQTCQCCALPDEEQVFHEGRCDLCTHSFALHQWARTRIAPPRYDTPEPAWHDVTVSSDCTCEKTYATYDGPARDCRIHGESPKDREIERLRADLARLSDEWRAEDKAWHERLRVACAHARAEKDTEIEQLRTQVAERDQRIAKALAICDRLDERERTAQPCATWCEVGDELRAALTEGTEQ